jgi:hypothetical protein
VVSLEWPFVSLLNSIPWLNVMLCPTWKTSETSGYIEQIMAQSNTHESTGKTGALISRTPSLTR